MRTLMAASLLLSAGCRKGAIQPNSRVRLEFTLSVEGKVYEASEPGRPLDVTIGDGQLAPGLEKALKGMRSGDEKTVTLTPEQGFGPRDPTAIQQMPLTMFGDLAKDLAVGRAVQGVRGGKSAEGLIVAMDDRNVTLDFNHRLAGKTLVYKVRIVSVQ